MTQGIKSQSSGIVLSLRWRHERDKILNHQPCDCFLNRLFRHRSKKTSKLRTTGLCEGNSPVTGEFSAQRASNAESVSIWWRHHVSWYYHFSTGNWYLMGCISLFSLRADSNKENVSMTSWRLMHGTRPRPVSISRRSSQFWNLYYKDKTPVRHSYLYNGNAYTVMLRRRLYIETNICICSWLRWTKFWRSVLQS